MTHVAPIDLLKKSSEPSEQIRVVYGQAGSGKTTLLKQMCRALSRNEAESDFDLVLYFPLRDELVSNAHDIPSLLKYYVSEDKRLDQAALAQSMVKRKSTGLLLVFDGADEVKDLPPIVHLLLQHGHLPEPTSSYPPALVPAPPCRTTVALSTKFKDSIMPPSPHT